MNGKVESDMYLHFIKIWLFNVLLSITETKVMKSFLKVYTD